ncbi:hypothetical protein VC625_04495 [Citrobacter freundii]|nr:transposase family protein [Citrobacter freundii]MBJ8786602.1 hypothetical protein [Citrobacter freundii]MDV0654215.1 hypothetical protein [Citrobacter freundii]MDV0719940.1 hypothetical protein [Citrobacter freundii]MEB0614721.1 hypothetical protein [Citrobacter freundii]MEB0689915.1 hypothetical protein [Citrobacter freundii]
MDNGPELISLTLAQWVEERDVVPDFIKTGKPTQNAFHFSLRDELCWETI